MLRALMGRVVALVALALAGAGLWPRDARADEAPPEVPPDFPRLRLETGRVEAAAPEADTLKFFVHGEDQIRYQAMRSFPLVATASAMAAHPGLVEQSLGQNQFVSHWLRLTPRFQVGTAIEVVGQIEITGLIVGDKARDTSADATPRDEWNGFSNLQPRWLYAQYKFPLGLVRVGMQPNHWGMGIFANDGDHPPLFGDYRYGQISERLLFATKPAGKNSDFYLALAGDLVFRDNFARLTRGEQAYQAVLAAFYQHGQDTLGTYTALRHQAKDGATVPTDQLDLLAVDLYGKIVRPVPGDTNTFLFAEAEAAYLFGSTNEVRTPAQALGGGGAEVRSYGGAAAVGVVHQRGSDRDIRYGDLVAQVELGYASGDADPYDGTQKRFVFDPNHRVGLLLFDEILRFQTARSATAAADPLLTGSGSVSAAAIAPSNGGVFGAQYLNPTAIVRPRPWLDLKGGVVIAQATSDVVDPYRLAVYGTPVNYRGGDPRKKDLGIELDAGAEARFPLPRALTAQVGAQAGVLFPGGAFEDAGGVSLPTQWVTVGRLGLQL
jgi:hypothetical protein